MEPRRFDVEGEQRRHGGFERVAERDGQLAKRRRAAAAGGEQQFIAQNFLTRRVFSLSPLNGERVGVRGLSILKRPPHPGPLLLLGRRGRRFFCRKCNFKLSVWPLD